MPKNLLIIESPAKAKTLRKYLGPEFTIMASIGHVKDLPLRDLGVDIEHGFQPNYEIVPGKAKVLKSLKAAGKDAEAIYLAPDPDREGEAIAWHIAQELGTKDKAIHRVLFNELTGRAIMEAVAHPQTLNKDKYESQQARRILDRLVGYLISPLLWRKVKGGLSAGRVQSVALKMICDREREIQAFEREEYWSLSAHLKAEEPPTFEAKLFKVHGKQAALKNEEQTRRVMEEIQGLPFTVRLVTRKEKKKNSPPPYITSLLQQEAYNRLRFSAKKTMSVAQALYEGVEIGERGQVGLITYMRTDSFRLSDEAISQARNYIEGSFGKDYLPSRPNRYKSREGAQEAHEAIRPTSVDVTPESVSAYLNKDQSALYSLIWKSFVASQMRPALLDQTQAEIEAGPGLFKATGSVMVFKGYTAVHEEGPLDSGAEKESDKRLPPLKEGQTLGLEKLEPAQHFTQPPPRYTEATLIKALEANGIGRPSTYASILGNINGREYVTQEERRFRPTELGFMVTDLLVKGFPDIMDTAFTAQMESNLDKVEKGDVPWGRVIQSFYEPFEKSLKRAREEMKGEVSTDALCPQCDRPLVIKSGKNGLFLACTGYPECKYTANFVRDEKGKIIPESGKRDEKVVGTCEECGRPMVIKNGRFGAFVACSGYPQCKNTGPRPLVKTHVKCPEKDCPGIVVEKTSKKGKRFYSCDQYPRCRFALWDEPVEDTCPQCGTPVMILKQSKGGSPFVACRKEGCRFKKSL